MSAPGSPTQRLDRWLWHARMFRTRSLAARFAVSGKIRVNATRVSKASHPVEPGDVLTFPLAGRVRVLQIMALAERRGPHARAVGLYADLGGDGPAPGEGGVAACAARPPGAGRPTKLERRRIGTFASPDGRGGS
jgi:ribosome-associated heat shock protein Hsp15